MAVYTIKVSLAVDGGNNTIVLTPTFCEVDLDKNAPSRIVWVLDRADARFVPHPQKKIDWEKDPDPGIFDDFDHNKDMNIISIRDNHFGRGKGKLGEWRYRLTVKQGTAIYTTPGSGSGSHKTEGDGSEGGKTPVIINR